MTATLFGMDIPADVAPRMTERGMLDLVHRRFGSVSNGHPPRYVVADHVGSNPDQPDRKLDAVVCDTWRSSGYAMHGIEVKVSRGDLKRELDDPAKALTFSEHLDYFWLAVPDKRALSQLTVPDKWGVLTVVERNGLSWLRQARRATRLRPAVGGRLIRDPIPRAMQVALVRATRKTYERIGGMA
jgi:hypothetical protein